MVKIRKWEFWEIPKHFSEPLMSDDTNSAYEIILLISVSVETHI